VHSSFFSMSMSPACCRWHHVFTQLVVNADPLAATAKQIPKKIRTSIQFLGMRPLQLANLRNVPL
jgi:hypothetical protein